DVRSCAVAVSSVMPGIVPSDGRALRGGDLGGQVLQDRIGPRPRSAVMLADGAVSRGLDAQRQPEDLDEPDRRRVVERIALVVRGERLVVQRHRGAPPDDDSRPVVKTYRDLA